MQRKISYSIVATLAFAAAVIASLNGCAGSKPEHTAQYSPQSLPATSTVSNRSTTIYLLTTTGSSSGTGIRAQGVPTSETLQGVVDDAYAKFKDDNSGKNADYIPYLASVPSELFGIAIVTIDGRVFLAGDTTYAFSIQSCSKVFTLAEIIQESGEDDVLKKIGVEPTGMPFNSITAIGLHDSQAINPLVNAGAMASVSMVQASGADDRWNKI